MKKVFVLITVTIMISAIFLFVLMSNSASVSNQTILPEEKNDVVITSELPTPEVKVERIIDCDDTKYFALSKKKSIGENYSPSVVPTGLSGGREVTEETKVALESLFSLAKSKDLKLNMASGYRSYATQKSLFTSYANKELAKNPKLSKVQAEEIANIYSARPGQSEHQLGTTADITCVGCQPFGNDSANQKVYDFLAQHAHEFGFAISYPKDTQDITGYKYEPWHIRYLGKDIAADYKKEYDSRQGKYPLQLYLEMKCAENATTEN